MKKRLIRKLHELITLIVSANLEELDKIGLELIEIEKKVMQLKIKNNFEKDLINVQLMI